MIRIAKFGFLFFILTVIVVQGKKELQGISWKASLQSINHISTWHMAILIIVALLAVGIMCFYDYLFIRSQGLKIKKTKILGVSWIANTFNGIFGFGGLVGASIRGMFYRQHAKDSSKLAKGVALLAPAAAMGLSILSIACLIGILPVDAILSEKKWLFPVMLGTALFFPIYIGFAAYRKSTYFTPSLTVNYSIISVLEWVGAGIVFYLSFMFAGIQLDFSQIFGMFVIGAVTGFISMVPGGLGSFDLMVLYSGQLFGVDPGLLLLALFLYRFVYYILPFAIGLILAAVEMTTVIIKKTEENNVFESIAEIGSVVWAVQRHVFSKVGYWSISILAFITGYFIIFATILDIVWYHGLGKSRLTLLTIDFYYLLLFACGITMWFFMKELYYRTKRSLYIMTVTLGIATILLVFQSQNIIIGLLAAAHLLVLILVRNQFKRHSLPFTAASIRRMLYLCITGFILFVYFVRQGLIAINYSKPLYGIYGIGLAGCIVACIYIIFAVLLFGKKHRTSIGESYDEDKLTLFLREHGGHALSHLGYLGDKRLFFSDDRKAMVQFAVIGGNLVVLGDPQGNPDSFENVLVKLHDEADFYGYNCIFYQISDGLLPLYHDLGYTFFKLGEEAIVDLDTFTISGKKRAGLRATYNRFEKNGYTFSVMDPPFSDSFFAELHYVSDQWLGNKKEKQFSLGHFDEGYLSKAPIATLTNEKGELVAFMNVMPVYQDETISVDLMRFLPNVPSGTMDVMFIYLFQWAKERGYRYFNLGMAPLANVGKTKHSFFCERIGATVFTNVRKMYRFSGLRKFKNKYYPVWSGKYLAYRKSYSLASVMIHITKLVNKGGKTWEEKKNTEDETELLLDKANKAV